MPLVTKASASADSNHNNDDHFATAAVQEELIEINNHDANNQPLLLLDTTTTTTTSIEEEVPDPAAADNETRIDLLRVQVERLQGKIALLNEKNCRLKTENKSLRRQQEQAMTLVDKSISSRTNEGFIHQVLEALKGVCSGKYRRWSSNRVCTLVAKAVWSQDKFVPYLVQHARKHFREKILTNLIFHRRHPPIHD